MNFNELSSQSPPSSTATHHAAAVSSTERFTAFGFNASPSGALKHCLDRVPDVCLLQSLLGPGPCVLNGLPSEIELSNGTIVKPTREKVDDILSQLQLFVESMDVSTKPILSDDSLMAIRLYTIEYPIPLGKYVNMALSDTDSFQRIGNFAPFLRLLIKSLEAYGEAGHYAEGAVFRALRARQSPEVLHQYETYKATFVEGGQLAFAGFTRVSLDGTLPAQQFGGVLLFSIQSVRGVDVSMLSCFPDERELLLVPPMVFRIDSVSKFHGVVSISVSQVEHADACYIKASSPICSAPVSNESMTSSLLQNDFRKLYYRLLFCQDRAVWDQMHTLANDNHDPLAQAVLAIGYSSGLFSKEDAETSRTYGNQCVSWLHSQTDMNSCFCLGLFYCWGVSVTANEAEAMRYWRLAADAGSEYAQVSLGISCERNADYDEARRWFQLAADTGYCAPQYYIGLQYFFGKGVEVDYVEAVGWFRLAAAQGYKDSQNLLGVCYERGLGVAANDAEMIEWFKRAAAQHYELAQYNLGMCFEKGAGVPKDINEAIRLYSLASEKGYGRATLRLQKLQN